MIRLCLFVLALLAVSAERKCFSPPTVRNSGWTLVGDAHPEMEMGVSIALQRRNVDIMEKELMAVSDPRSPRYGMHYSIEELRDSFGPDPVNVEKVASWLEAEGAELSFSLANEYVSVSGLTVGDLERIFHVDLEEYANDEDERIVRAAASYCVPEHVADIVYSIPGMHSFPKREQRVEPFPQARAVEVVPSDLDSFYRITEAKSAVRGSSQAPVQFGGNYFNTSDLQTFEKDYRPAIKGEIVRQIYGQDNLDTKTSIEANLDVQYIMAMGNFVNTSVYIQKCGIVQSIVDCFISYTELVASQIEPPLVHTISYGMYGGQYDNKTVQRLNEDFQAMGLRGISILLASGDNGVGCNNDCTSFEFDFPSSPYITMVGATYFDSNGKEYGATLSSGGFSEDYFRPSYQNDAVNGYFNSGVKLPAQSLWYRNGRAYPDVAAAGERLAIIVKGKREDVSGTSCSAPIFGGIIALLNNDRINDRKASLGFLNPWLYQNPGMFNPINTGNNEYCPGRNGCCCQGFDGTNGWDPVTGLGSPDYVKMQKAMP